MMLRRVNACEANIIVAPSRCGFAGAMLDAFEAKAAGLPRFFLVNN
ncbi:MAG TPA: hypothetical protein VN681_10060 [Stellaceae bacterium]|nr:hypothetical protein [Stellaceae bacterium]